MLVVKVELWPHGREDKATELVRMFLANDGTSRDPKIGHYNVAVMRKGEKRAPWKHGDGLSPTAKPIRTGRVEGHAKSAYHVLRLVTRGIRAMFPEWGDWDAPPVQEEFHGKQLSWKGGHAQSKTADADAVEETDSMVHIRQLGGGTSNFRCTNCGANVFRKFVHNPKRYKCNGCGDTYTGEGGSTQEPTADESSP